MMAQLGVDMAVVLLTSISMSHVSLPLQVSNRKLWLLSCLVSPAEGVKLYALAQPLSGASIIKNLVSDITTCKLSAAHARAPLNATAEAGGRLESRLWLHHAGTSKQPPLALPPWARPWTSQ